MRDLKPAFVRLIKQFDDNELETLWNCYKDSESLVDKAILKVINEEREYRKALASTANTNKGK